MIQAAEEADTSPSPTEWLRVAGLAALLTGIANLPYVLAYLAPGEMVFGGVLLNPTDGYSYLAKMRQGWRGEWLFSLPYTAEPGTGVFLYSYYLFLGHFARWSGLGLEAVLFLARAAGGLFFLSAAYGFVAHFTARRPMRLLVWLAFSFTSGLGWAAALAGGFTADLWVAESIPFLSLLVNPHFPLAAGLMLALLAWTLPGLDAAPYAPLKLARIAAATTGLAQVQPLGLLTTGLALGAGLAARGLSLRRLTRAEVLPALAFGLSGLPWAAYDYLVVVRHPVLSGWNAQNLTPSPPVFESLVWGGVPLALASVGALQILRQGPARQRMLVWWLGLGALSLYAPFGLQRRLSLGLWMPLTLLAAAGLAQVLWPRLSGGWGARLRPALAGLLLAAAILSNVLVYAAALGAVARQDDDLFLSRDEAAALEWLASQEIRRPLVAASPELSLFIPARSDARVVYGHPFETAQADERRQEIESLYSGAGSTPQLLADWGVDYVVYGPRESRYGGLPELGPGWRQVWQAGLVTVYGR